MPERTTRKTVTFSHPFKLPAVDDTLDSGTYDVETIEEQIDAMSRVAYRRISTSITIYTVRFGSVVRQVVEIDPADLDAALARDAGLQADAAAASVPRG